MSNLSAKVLTKLLNVQQSIPALPKAAQNSSQNYKFWAVDAVIPEARAALAANGLVLMQNVVGEHLSESAAGIPRRVFEYIFVLADVDSGEYMEYKWIHDVPLGTLSREGKWTENDKTAGIAHSYAQKYFIIKLLMIVDRESVENDADNGKHDEAQSHQQTQQKTPPAAKPAPAPQAEGDESFIAEFVVIDSTSTGKPRVTALSADKKTKASGFTTSPFAPFMDVSAWKNHGEYPIKSVRVLVKRNGNYLNIDGVQAIETRGASDEMPF